MHWSDERINNFYAAVGTTIKEARVRAKVSQVSLAERLGLARSSITNIEAGRQRVQLHWLVQIANALDVPVSQIMVQPGFEGQGPVHLPDIEGQPETTESFVSAVVQRVGLG